MGREIRRVPPNWEQPKNERGHLQPMFDQTFSAAAEEWKARLAKHVPSENDGREYWEWDGNPPDREYYRPWEDEDATWFQVWETVSEGTPVTPPFATKIELVDYLVANGDAWDQSRGNGGWGRKAAERFVNAGWAPSMVVFNSGTDVTIKTPRDGIV